MGDAVTDPGTKGWLVAILVRPHCIMVNSNNRVQELGAWVGVLMTGASKPFYRLRPLNPFRIFRRQTFQEVHYFLRLVPSTPRPTRIIQSVQ